MVFDPNQHVSSAEPLFFKKEDKCVADPVFIMAATVGNDTNHPSQRPNYRGDSKKKRVVRCADLAEKISSLAPALPKGNSETLKAQDIGDDEAKRNVIIDSMVGASDRKCGRYIDFLKSYDGNVNSILGTTSLIAAGASPLVAGEATAKVLAGISAMLNGTRETLNQTHFANQTVQVLAAAIGKLRQQERREITNYEQCPLSKYSTANGFSDALNYHASCSVVYGLAETARDVERANSPDIATMKQMLTDLLTLRDTAAAFAARPSSSPGSGTAAGTPSAAGSGAAIHVAPVGGAGPATQSEGVSSDNVQPTSINVPVCPLIARSNNTSTVSSAGIPLPVAQASRNTSHK